LPGNRRKSARNGRCLRWVLSNHGGNGGDAPPTNPRIDMNMNLNLNHLNLNPLDLDLVQTAMSYWTGALSEPVQIIDRHEMARALARGAIIWDVRPRDEFERRHEERAISLGSVDWLLAEASGGNLIPADVIAEVLYQAGIHRGLEVVVYAERHAVDAFVALRALRSIGMSDAHICIGDARDDVRNRQRIESPRASGGWRSARNGSYSTRTHA
jgi:hypothetical protein